MLYSSVAPLHLEKVVWTSGRQMLLVAQVSPADTYSFWTAQTSRLFTVSLQMFSCRVGGGVGWVGWGSPIQASRTQCDE